MFAFDPDRRAILLVAGDKAGQRSEWCTVNIPIADDRFDDHLNSGEGQLRFPKKSGRDYESEAAIDDG